MSHIQWEVCVLHARLVCRRCCSRGMWSSTSFLETSIFCNMVIIFTTATSTLSNTKMLCGVNEAAFVILCSVYWDKDAMNGPTFQSLNSKWKNHHLHIERSGWYMQWLTWSLKEAATNSRWIIHTSNGAFYQEKKTKLGGQPSDGHWWATYSSAYTTTQVVEITTTTTISSSAIIVIVNPREKKGSWNTIEKHAANP